MHESRSLQSTFQDLTRQSPFIVHPHHLHLIQDHSNFESLSDLFLLLSFHLCNRHTQHMLCQTKRKLLGRRTNRIPNYTSLDLLSDFEIGFRVEIIEMEQVDCTVKVAEELDVETRREGSCDESSDEATGEDRGDGSCGTQLIELDEASALRRAEGMDTLRDSL